MEQNDSNKIKNDIVDTFELLDGNKDQLVTMTELGELIKLIKPETRDEEINEVKKELGHEDFSLSLYEAFWKNKLTDGSNFDDLNDYNTLFKFFDTDNNGLIDARNLMEGLEKIGVKISPDEADEMVLEADQDADRLLNLREFSRMIRLID